MTPDNNILEHLKYKRWEQAFNLIVDQYSEPLYWRIRQLIVTHDDTHDILQDSFIKIWKALPNFRGDSKVYSWLYRIVTNEALNHLKKEKRKSDVSLDKSEIQITSDAYINESDSYDKLLAAIEQLPEKQQLVFNMKYFENLSYDEISFKTKTSVGALKANFHHARSKIINLLNLDD